MKKTGEILKKARESKKLSLHEIGLSLKISNKILKAIEEGDEKHLPAKTFLRGFVQSYANYLHLDTDKVLEVFYEEMGSTRPKPYIRNDQDKSVTQESPVEGEASEVSTATVTPLRENGASSSSKEQLESLHQNKNTKTIVISILAIILVGLILFTKKMIDKYSKEAEVPTAEVAQTMEGATPVVPETPNQSVAGENGEEEKSEGSELSEAPNASPTPALTAAPAIIPSPSPTVVMTPKVTPVVTPTPVASPSPTPSPSPSPSPTPTPVATVTPSPTPVATATATPTATIKPEASAKPVQLIVEALDTVEIEYSAPNGKPQKIRLTAEQVHTFKSKSGLNISFSNGGAVNLILNGKEVGIPGDLGKPIKLSY